MRDNKERGRGPFPKRRKKNFFEISARAIDLIHKALLLSKTPNKGKGKLSEQASKARTTDRHHTSEFLFLFLFLFRGDRKKPQGNGTEQQLRSMTMSKHKGNSKSPPSPKNKTGGIQGNDKQKSPAIRSQISRASVPVPVPVPREISISISISEPHLTSLNDQ